VAAFGAFVDIGVHQDGLVHVSALANRFVKDPHDVVKPGQIVKVKVLDVDAKRQRISLTMRLDDAAALGSGAQDPPAQGSRMVAPKRRLSGLSQGPARPAQPIGAMAQALARAKQKQ
jgi:protein Tex